MTPTISQSAWRPLFERFAFRAPDPETFEPQTQPRLDDHVDEERGFVRRDEAFYWGWSMNAFW